MEVSEREFKKLMRRTVWHNACRGWTGLIKYVLLFVGEFRRMTFDVTGWLDPEPAGHILCGLKLWLTAEAILTFSPSQEDGRGCWIDLSDCTDDVWPRTMSRSTVGSPVHSWSVESADKSWIERKTNGFILCCQWRRGGNGFRQIAIPEHEVTDQENEFSHLRYVFHQFVIRLDEQIVDFVFKYSAMSFLHWQMTSHTHTLCRCNHPTNFK